MCVLKKFYRWFYKSHACAIVYVLVSEAVFPFPYSAFIPPHCCKQPKGREEDSISPSPEGVADRHEPWDTPCLRGCSSCPLLHVGLSLHLGGPVFSSALLPKERLFRVVTDPPLYQDTGSISILLLARSPGLLFLSLLMFSPLFQGAFPGNLQLVFVLRPSRFIQRAIADIGIKLYRDDFKMKVPVSIFLLLLLLECFGSYCFFSSKLSSSSPFHFYQTV